MAFIQDCEKSKVSVYVLFITVTVHLMEVSVFVPCTKAKREGRRGEGSIYLYLHFSYTTTNFLSHVPLIGNVLLRK